MESPDFYGCIHRACRLKEGSPAEFDLIVLEDNRDILRFCARQQSENGIMFLRLELSDTRDILPSLPRNPLWEKEIPDILNCSEEFMQNNLLPLLSYMFLGLFIKVQEKNDFAEIDRDEWRNLGIEAGIVGTDYKHVFNSLFFAMCSFFFSIYKGFGEDVIYVNENRKFPKVLAQEQEKILLSLEPARALCLMKFFASIRPLNDERALRISYSSSVGGLWRIASYSPLVSLEKTRVSRTWKLNSTERFHLLNCILQFGHFVRVRPSLIEVCLQMDNVTCDVLPLNPKYSKARISGAVPSKRYFPAKICLTISPEIGHGVRSISLSVSSPNPIKDIGKENNYEATTQTPDTQGVEASASTTSTKKIKNWGFEQSVVNSTGAKIDWTLYNVTTGKPVYNNGPSKISFLRHKTPSIDRAFTEQGGVVFAKDDYGKPITWRLNRNLEGQILKWIVQASIWLTYKPNTRYSETLRHDFRQVVDLKLETTSTHN